ncbi:MAG: hypothetical protein HYX81_03220 [Chloroflexi bacterium]|nr:hypothetical protein [Chloroflexota bacterium]MBI4267428.1 hypothetical protein [Chloroflexota bacterium]
MATGGEISTRVAEARSRFLRRLSVIQKSFKEFKEASEFFLEFMEVEADRRLRSCQHFNGKYCNAWERKSGTVPLNRFNYEAIDSRYYVKDPSFLCAPCPLYEAREKSR